jgi:hypothetical protein
VHVICRLSSADGKLPRVAICSQICSACGLTRQYAQRKRICQPCANKLAEETRSRPRKRARSSASSSDIAAARQPLSAAAAADVSLPAADAAGALCALHKRARYDQLCFLHMCEPRESMRAHCCYCCCLSECTALSPLCSRHIDQQRVPGASLRCCTLAASASDAVSAVAAFSGTDVAAAAAARAAAFPSSPDRPAPVCSPSGVCRRTSCEWNERAQ